MADNTAEQEALQRKARLKALRAKKESNSDAQVSYLNNALLNVLIGAHHIDLSC